MDVISLIRSAMNIGPYFVIAVLSLLVAYEAVRKKGDKK